MTDALAFSYDAQADNFRLGDGNLAEAMGLFEGTDFVSFGMQFTPDYANLKLDISDGGALVDDGTDVYGALLDPKTKDLTNNAVNDVYVVIDPSNGSVSYSVLTSGTPSNPYLKIGEVDTNNDTFDDTINDYPDVRYETLEAEQVDIADWGMPASIVLQQDGSDIIGVRGDNGSVEYREADVQTVIETGAADGFNTFYLPEGLTYVASSDTTPSDITIIGEGVDSVVESTDTANNTLYVGPQTSLRNVGINSGNLDGSQAWYFTMYANNDEDVSHRVSAARGALEINSGNAGEDHNNFVGRNKGTGDVFYGYSAEGMPIRTQVDPNNALAQFQWQADSGSGGYSRQGRIGPNGWIELDDTVGLRNLGQTNNQFFPEDETLTDNATAELLPSLATNEKAGFLFVRSGASAGLFNLRGGVNAVDKMLDPTNSFTTTSGNDGTTNLYWDGSQYEIENKTGQQSTFTMWFKA